MELSAIGERLRADIAAASLERIQWMLILCIAQTLLTMGIMTIVVGVLR